VKGGKKGKKKGKKERKGGEAKEWFHQFGDHVADHEQGSIRSRCGKIFTRAVSRLLDGYIVLIKLRSSLAYLARYRLYAAFGSHIV